MFHKEINKCGDLARNRIVIMNVRCEIDWDKGGTLSLPYFGCTWESVSRRG